jgi:hypothetical protein
LTAATTKIEVSGFHKNGLFPVNRNISNEHEFTVGHLEPNNAHSLFVLPADIGPVPTRQIQWNISEHRVNLSHLQGNAILVIGSPHKQKVNGEHVRKEARENSK